MRTKKIMEWIYVQGKMKGSVFVELALKTKNKKNTGHFCDTPGSSFSKISLDILELVRSLRRLLWRLESVKAHLEELYYASGPFCKHTTTWPLNQCIDLGV